MFLFRNKKTYFLIILNTSSYLGLCIALSYMPEMLKYKVLYKWNYDSSLVFISENYSVKCTVFNL